MAETNNSIYEEVEIQGERKKRRLKPYFKLMRIHHYLKNGLVFAPLIFSGQLLNASEFFRAIIGFLAFSFTASIIYIINDIQDVENDRKHPVKCKRPIASGDVKVPEAWVMVAGLLVLVCALNYYIAGLDINLWGLIALYIVLNIAYSYGLKNKPLIDITILVSGFLIRVLYGAKILDIGISSWLYLTVISLSFYLGLGKRRNEITKQGSTSRKVLKYYTQSFLDKNMYMCLGLTIMFYSLWCVDPATVMRHSNEHIIYTVPLVMLICMKYSLTIEGNSYGDPVDVLLGDKIIILMILLYAAATFFIIYI